MASSNDKIVAFRWDVENYRKWWNDLTNKRTYSGSFKLGSARFALFYKPSDTWLYDRFGVILQDLPDKQPLEVKLKLWFEDKKGQKFQENLIEKHVFNKVGEYREFYFNSNKDSIKEFFFNIFWQEKRLYICCELTDLHKQATPPITGLAQQFQQNIWSTYKEGMPDSIIKIGETEFEVFKLPFMAQSDIFKQMFNSSFKQSRTSVISVNGVSEQAMVQLIKWMYLCQIEDKSFVEDLFEIADKYAIKLLKVNCSELMINSLNDSNALRRFILATVHDEAQLKNAALSYINKMPKNKFDICLASLDWIEFVRENPDALNEVSQLIAEKLKN